MSNEELQRQTELSDELIAKLERIKALWDEIPTDDDLLEVTKAASSLAFALEKTKEVFADEGFPTEDDLLEVAEAASSIAGL